MYRHAILIDYLEWDAPKVELTLDKSISFISLKKHHLGTLLNKQLRKLIKYWDEELFDCQTAIIINQSKRHDIQIEPSEQTYSYSTELLTILTLIFKTDLGLCRVITSEDNFKTCVSTYTIYDNYPSVIESLAADTKFNLETFEILKSAWSTLQTLNYPKFHPRVINAFDFYYFSWNSINLHSTTINLSVVLETLFSPSSTNELSHQIAYNVAKFLYPDKKERVAGYQFVKKFYTIRSKLVHGGDIKLQELNIVIEFFKLISSILLKILTDITLFNTFNEDRSRKKFLEELLFD